MLLSALGCVPPEPEAMAPEAAAKLDRPLREVVEASPDSVVGVLVRTRAHPEAGERAQLSAAGLSIGAVVGDVVSGRIVARHVPELAALDFVLRVRLARPIPEPRPPTDVGPASDPDSQCGS